MRIHRLHMEILRGVISRSMRRIMDAGVPCGAVHNTPAAAAMRSWMPGRHAALREYRDVYYLKIITFRKGLRYGSNRCGN